MATLNSLDGVITSGGSNPPINTDFPCTLYRIEFPVVGGSIEYINHTGTTRKWSLANTALSDRISKVISINGVKLTDLGLVFNIPAPASPLTFKTVTTGKIYNVKSFRIYFGTPTKPSGTIVYNDETGAIKQLSLLGTTAVIKASKFNNLTNVRIVDLNPEIVDFPEAPKPPFSIIVGSYGTVLTPVTGTDTISFLNPPIVDLKSGGNTPILNVTFAATSYDIEFPEVGTGTIEYVDQNGKTKKYTLNKLQVFTPNGLLNDSIIKVTILDNVKLIDKGLVYQIVEPTPSPKFIVPTELPIKPTKPKFYHVYFGNPVHPQGSVTYFDAKGANKMITNFGKIVTIDASSIYQLSNVRLVEVGDVI